MNKIFHLKKIKAGALQLTLFVVVVVSILLFSFLLFVDIHKQFSVKADLIEETIENSNHGVHYALLNDLSTNDGLQVDLNSEDYKSLRIHKSYWGVFEKITSVSKIKNNEIAKVALVGGMKKTAERTALYLHDNNKPLILVGNTEIQGVAYLPRQGVKSGNIGGYSYYGSSLIHGQSKVISNFPTISNEFLKYLDEISDAVYSDKQFININNLKSFSVSFFDETRVILETGKLVLENIELKGNIIVKSKRKIIVKPSCKLSDVILLAPEIEIEDQTKGKFQAIATKQLLVGENVTLNYPSALVLKKVEENTAQKERVLDIHDNQLFLGKESVLKGVVLYLENEIPKNNFKAQVLIDDGSVVFGEVFSSSNLELKGSVFGTVYTNNFLTSHSGSIYQNHIFNGKIKIDNLVKEYSGLIFNNKKKAVVKWLY